MIAIITISVPDLYSLVLLVGLFSYILGIIIRGILAERNEDNFRERIIEVHSEALKEVNRLRKDVKGEIAGRKVAEQMIERQKLEIATLQAHKPKTVSGGEPGFTEHVSTGLDMTSHDMTSHTEQSRSVSATGTDGKE